MTIGGKRDKAVEHLRRLASDSAASRVPAASLLTSTEGPPLALADALPAAWQVRFGASVTAGMSPVEMTQWESNPLSAAVPAVATEGSRLFVNYVGHVFAVDLVTGKMLWRSGSFHNLEIARAQDQARMIDTGRYAVIAAPGSVWTLGRDLREMAMGGAVSPDVPTRGGGRNRLANRRPGRVCRHGFRRVRQSSPRERFTSQRGRP